MAVERLLILLTILGSITSSNVLTDPALELRVTTYFNKWKDVLQSVPMPDMKGTYSGKGITIQYSASGMKLSGLNNTHIDNLEVLTATRQIKVALSVPALTLTADKYYLNGRVYLYAVKGSGNMRLEFDRVFVSINIFLNISDSNLAVDDLQIDYKILGFKAYLENCSWIVSQLLNREGLSIINLYYDDIVNMARENVMTLTNQSLAMIRVKLLEVIL